MVVRKQKVVTTKTGRGENANTISKIIQLAYFTHISGAWTSIGPMFGCRIPKKCSPQKANFLGKILDPENLDFGLSECSPRHSQKSHGLIDVWGIVWNYGSARHVRDYEGFIVARSQNFVESRTVFWWPFCETSFGQTPLTTQFPIFSGNDLERLFQVFFSRVILE